MIIPNYHLDELQEVARKLISNFKEIPVWCFYAEMGSGKTTLIKQICRELGVQSEMSSPTFSLINIYEGAHSEVYHFDFYRMNETLEAVDIGAEDYFFSSHPCFIEWPELVLDLLPERYVEINIKLLTDKTRSLTAQSK